MRNNYFKRAHQFKEALLRLRRERNKALLECRKVTCNNYTFHELTQQFSMVKRARPFSLHKMAQFRRIPPEIGTSNTSLWCWSTRLGLENCATSHGSPTALSWQTGHLRTHPVQDSSSMLPTAFLLSTSSPRPTPDFQQHRYAKTQLSFLIFRSISQTKVLCYSTNEPPLQFPLSPQLWVSVEHYWGGVLVCRLGHMTEDIFFCYDAKEAPGKDKQTSGLTWAGRAVQQNTSVAKSFLLTGTEQKSAARLSYLNKSISLIKVFSNHRFVKRQQCWDTIPGWSLTAVVHFN